MKAFIALLLFSAAANGQLPAADKSVQSACAAIRFTPLPGDMALTPEPKNFPSCDSYSLYEKKDFKSARACAIQERLALLARLPDSPAKPVVPNADIVDSKPAGGLVVLSELYANGEGVARNPSLAMRFFCEAIDTGEVEHDSSETADILDTLKRLRTLTPNSPHLTYCDLENSIPAANTPLTRYCEDKAEEAHAEMHSAGIQDGIDSAQQDADDADAAISPILKKLTTAQLAAYRRAADAMQHFIEAQVTGDVLYMGGYGSGGLYPNEEHANFENQVRMFVSQHPEIPAPSRLDSAEAALNAAYRQLMRAATSDNSNGITREKLRVEQRAWLTYRDALIAFGKTLDPQLPDSAWLLPITIPRTTDLLQVYDSVGKQWIVDAQRERSRLAQVAANQDARVESMRSHVSQYFESPTPPQSEAWKHVQDALSELDVAHRAARPQDPPIYANLELEAMYGELYVHQQNSQHRSSGGVSFDQAKAEANLAANNKRLNAAYQAGLASPCLVQTGPDGRPSGYSSVADFRAEERAWLALREAWVSFLGPLFPEGDRTGLAAMFTGRRAFELEVISARCRNMGHGSASR